MGRGSPDDFRQPLSNFVEEHLTLVQKRTLFSSELNQKGDCTSPFPTPRKECLSSRPVNGDGYPGELTDEGKPFVPDTTFKYCPLCTTSLVEKHIYDAQRLTCPACGFILFLEPKLVTVVVIQNEGKVLLGRRNMEPARGLWSFISGYVDRGEKVEEAAIREVKEETNLDVQLEGLIGIYSANGNPHVVIAYQASILNNDISGLLAQPEEVSELAFFSLEEIPPLAFPADEQIAHYLREL